MGVDADEKIGSFQTVSTNKEIKFVINVSSTALVNFTGFAMHWGETCQNDVIEGFANVVPLPGTLPLFALGVAGLAFLRRSRPQAG